MSSLSSIYYEELLARRVVSNRIGVDQQFDGIEEMKVRGIEHSQRSSAVGNVNFVQVRSVEDSARDVYWRDEMNDFTFHKIKHHNGFVIHRSRKQSVVLSVYSEVVEMPLDGIRQFKTVGEFKRRRFLSIGRDGRRRADHTADVQKNACGN
jgi:hypothetical protein